MKFLLDMNMSPAWVASLAQAGYEAVHWSAVGSADAADRAIADYARTHGFVIITSDLDFGKLLNIGQEASPSVIQLRLGDLRPVTMLETFLQTIDATRADLEQGALVTIGRSRVRVSILPPGEDEE